MVRFAAAALALAAIALGASASGDELVLLDFWSPTCGPCMQMKPTVHSLENAGYPIRQIDASREPELARQYGVTGIPCFVMLVGGQEVDRVVGATSSERLQQMFARAKEVVQSQSNPRFRGQNPESLQPTPPAGQSIPWPEVGDDPARGAAGALDQARVGGGVYDQGRGTEMRNDSTGGAPGVAPSQEDASWTRQVDAMLLSASVRLRVDDPQGHSYGTGTIIDSRQGEALVITCGHLFRDTKGEGQVTAELFETGPDGARVVAQVSAKLLRYDLERDVAMLSIRPNRPVTVAQVAPTRTAIERGDRAASVGCSNGKDPTVEATRITWLDRYQGPPNIEASGAPVEGRSGGGLFNDRGQLVGICFAADRERNEGLYAALESIHSELDRLGMQEIYAAADSRAELAGRDRATMPPVVRGQEESFTPVMPIPAESQGSQAPATSIAIGPESSPPAAPAGFNATEQAAWEEIMNRAARYEVVCIVRPKEPGGQSEVITLDDVSPEFVHALADRQREPQTPAAR